MSNPAINAFFYGPHRTKSDYERAFAQAQQFSLENEVDRADGLVVTGVAAARIFHVKEDALRQSLCRLKKKSRNDKGLYNSHSRNNKILSNA
jgi:hypothetical protein